MSIIVIGPPFPVTIHLKSSSVGILFGYKTAFIQLLILTPKLD